MRNNVTELGKYLRKLRVDNDENLEVMGNKIGLARSYLSAVELGKKAPSNKMFLRLLEEYPTINRNELLLLIFKSKGLVDLSLLPKATEKELMKCLEDNLKMDSIISKHDEGRFYINDCGLKCEIVEVDLDYDEVKIEFYDEDVESYVSATMNTDNFNDEFKCWCE